MINLENYKEYENYSLLLNKLKDVKRKNSSLISTSTDNITLSNIFLAINKQNKKYLFVMDLINYPFNLHKSADALGLYFSEKVITQYDDVLHLKFLVKIKSDTKIVEITNECCSGVGSNILDVEIIAVELAKNPIYSKNDDSENIMGNIEKREDILSYNTCDNELIAAAIIIKDFNLELDEFKSIATSLLLFRGLSINTTNFFKDKEISYFLMNKDDYSTTIHAKHDNGEIIEVVIEHE